MASTDPFPASDFDAWAESYDRDIPAYGTFPFAGYDRVLDTVLEMAAAEPEMTVLDLGTGTGNLALRFARLGCKLWCTDFSSAMLDRAREKLPSARFVVHDLNQPWPSELDVRFDRIVSAYVFHHFEMPRKVVLAGALVKDRLARGGRLVLADISFPNIGTMREFARSIGDLWEQEPYWLADEAVAALEDAGLRVDYQQVSPCAGVYAIKRAG